MFENLTLIGLIQKGGVTVLLLAALSVISFAIILERAFAFRRFARDVRAFSSELASVIKGGRLSEAAGLCAGSASPLASVFMAGYSKKGGAKEDISGAMELAARVEVARLERFLGVLGTIGSTAPFIGLFGTVLGIIRAFSDLSVASGASPAAVADGIAEALVATAAGLFVAVPAVVAYNYFVRAASRHSLTIEEKATPFIDVFARGKADGLEVKQ